MGRSESVKVTQLDGNVFSPFGRVLEPAVGERPEVSEPGSFDFFVSFREPPGRENSPGWQIGYLVCSCRSLHQLERHPNTAEVFCPLGGEALLVAAEDGFTGDPAQPVGFVLNRPVVFNRGVWHGVISLTDRSTMLIVESSDVIDEFRKLDRPLAAP
jgi:ureidoglycolate hydrolase